MYWRSWFPTLAAQGWDTHIVNQEEALIASYAASASCSSRALRRMGCRFQ